MTTFTLTTGGDTITGGAGRDLITGTTDTWQAADTIDGGGGPDTLQITVATAAAATVADAMFQHDSNLKTLALIGKYAETVTLGGLSDTAGLTELDGSALTGILSVDASARMFGVTIDSAKGANTLTGTVTDDTFKFTSAGLTSTDKIDGGGVGDSDTIEITDKAALTDAALTHVTHVEKLAFGTVTGAFDYSGQKMTLGALSIAAGIKEVDVLNTVGATVDATARSTSGIVFHGGDGSDVLKASQANDTFLGGNGDDSLQIKEAQLTANDRFDGGAGRDEIRLLDSGLAITDGQFAQIHGVETLAFNAAGKQTVTLDADAAAAGLDTIDASKVTGGLTLTLTGGMTNAVTIDLGTGTDKLTLGDGSQHTVVMKSTSLTAADTITGNSNGLDTLSFSDAAKLTDTSFLKFAGVNHFAFLTLDSAAKGQSFVAGADFTAFAKADHLSEIIANGAAATTSVTFDFSKYNDPTAPALVVNGSGGGDVFIAGTVNNTYIASATDSDQGVADSFRYHAADFTGADTIYGGKSASDELVFLDDSIGILDTDLAGTHNVEVIRLAAASTGNYGLLLSANAQASGIDLVDASKAGVDVTVLAPSMSSDVTFIAGAKVNNFSGGSGDDTFVFDVKTLTGADQISGGGSTDGDTLKFSTGGAVSAVALGQVSGIEKIQFSDAGNALVLSDNVPASAQTITTTAYDNLQLHDATYILTGKGKDTVDLSQLTTGAGHVAVIGSGGGDKYIGSSEDDYFVFQHAADLTSTTVIDGGTGANHLVLAAGTYTAAQFKGVSNVYAVTLSDANAGANYSLTLDNSMFLHSQSHEMFFSYGAGIGDVTIDASAVTDPLAAIYVPESVGNDTYKGTAGDDYFYFGFNNTGRTELNNLDTVAGNGGTDTLDLGSGSFNGTVTLIDADLTHVSGIERLLLNGGTGTDWDLVLDATFQKEGIAEVLLNTTDSAHIDATQYTADITIDAGDGADTLLTGAGDDTIAIQKGSLASATLTSGDTINGGTGHNTLLFIGTATVVDADFAHVSHIQEIDVQESHFSVTLGANTDAAGIATIDASAAGSSGTVVNGTASALSLTIHGSVGSDLLEGGSGTDLLAGGAGGDVLLGGAGNNVFYYASAADSHQEANNNLSFADVIGDFHTGDTINIDNLVGDISGVTNKGQVQTFPTADTAGFFGGNQVAVEFDGNNTRVFVDANHDGNFNLNQDLVIQVVGNHLTALADSASYN